MKRHVSHLLISAILGAIPIVANADDTDIYMTTPSVARDDSPNVLIIFDTSGSMESNTITTRPAYNPATDYSTVAGAPSGIVNGRIYYSHGATLPSTGTNKWFLASNNNCEASKTNLGAGGNGVYGSDKIVYYRSTSQGWRHFRWANVNSRTIDCQGDAGATDPNGYLSRINSQMYTSNASDEVDWSGMTGSNYTPILYSANYMRYWHNTTLSSTQTRMEIAQNAIKGIIDANQYVRFGLMIFNQNTAADGSNGNHGGRVVMKVDAMDATRRTDMKNMVDSLAGSGYTPLVETLWEARRYFGGLSVDYGDNNSGFLPNRDATAENAAGNYISPFQYSCQQSYVIYMTDGDPRNDEDADSTIGTAVGGCDAEAGLDSDGGISCLDDLAGWMYNNDVYSGLPGQQRVITYTIGFGSGITAGAQTLLKETASRGKGQYYTANDADELTNAFQGALVDILATSAAFTAPALSVNAFNSLYHRDEVFFAMFKPSSTQYWDGNVKKYKLCDDITSSTCTFGEVIDRDGSSAIDPLTLRIKDTAKSYWGAGVDGNEVVLGGAGEQVPAPASRNLYTYTGAYGANGRAPTGNQSLNAAENLIASGNASLTAAMLGAADATTRDEVISWMKGTDVYDEDADGDTTENHWPFSDAMHSRPIVVTYGAELTAGVPDPDKPIVKLLVGTNDGGLRLINERTGQEEWVFVPKELLGMQQELARDANGAHPYGLDGTATIWLRDNNGNGIIEPNAPNNDKIYAYIGMRRGGRNLYALDITPSATLTDATVTNGVQPKLLWAIQGGTTTGYSALGQTWSRPLIADIRYGTATAGQSVSKQVLMFSGGYDDGQDTGPFPASADGVGNAIYIVDPLTGERLWWVSGTASGADLELASMDFSIPSDLAPVDSNGDGAIDRIYVGDVAGQLWRLDLSPTLKLNDNGTPASSGHVLADIACTAGTRPACTGTADVDRRKFFYPPNVAQVFDTTTAATGDEKYDVVTIASGNRADPLDLHTGTNPVHNGIYVFRDYDTDASPRVSYSTATISLGDLLDVTTRIPTNATELEALQNDLKTKEGWYIQLQKNTTEWIGEKSLAQTTIFAGTLYVTTYLPPSTETAASTCAANEGQGRLYALNLLTGAPVIDFDDNGSEDRTTDVGGGIPSETVIVIREEGVTGLVDTTLIDKINSDLPRYKTYWYH